MIRDLSGMRPDSFSATRITCSDGIRRLWNPKMRDAAKQPKLGSASGLLPDSISEVGLRADSWGWQAWCLYRADVLGIVLMQLPTERLQAEKDLSSRLEDDHGLDPVHAVNAARRLFQSLEPVVSL